MKFSKQREMILNEVLNSKDHPTADDIYYSLKKENPNLSLGTVYRNLTQLELNGYIKKLSVPGNPIRYDSNLETHYHFICEACGSIIDIESDRVKLNVKSLKNDGIKVDSSFIVLKGICAECNNKKNGGN